MVTRMPYASTAPTGSPFGASSLQRAKLQQRPENPRKALPLFGHSGQSLTPDQVSLLRTLRDYMQTPVNMPPPEQERSYWELRDKSLQWLNLRELRLVQQYLPSRTLPTDGLRPGLAPRPQHDFPTPPPTLHDFLSMRPGDQLSYNVPVLPDHSLNVKQPDTDPHLDLSPGSDAAKMIRGGQQPYEMSKSYGVKWSVEKTCRDILQNFFDSHGGTMEGVDFHVEAIPSRNNSFLPMYRVRVDGLGQYNYEKAFFLGEGGKLDDPTTAGGYGEGLKITALNLLRDFHSDSVKMSSADWSLTYTLPEGKRAQLEYELKHLDPDQRPTGSSMEFVTRDPRLVGSLFKAIDYFYHPYNADYQGSSYENAVGGFKLLPKGQAGHAYIAKQRYEVGKAGNWENSVPGMSLWLNHKAEGTAVDRDRSPLSYYDFNKIYRALIDKMPLDDKLALLRDMEPYWTEIEYPDEDSQERDEFEKPKELVGILIDSLMDEKVRIEFDSKFVADDLGRLSKELQLSQEDTRKMLEDAGYVVCQSDFAGLGMQTTSEMIPKAQPRLLKINNEAKEAQVVSPGEIPTGPPTPGEQVRFRVLLSALHLIRDEVFSSSFYSLNGSQFYFQESNSTHRQHMTPVSREVLAQPSFETAVARELFTFLDRDHSVYSSQYSYSLTDLTGSVLKFLSSRDAGEFHKLRQLWELSFQPDLDLKTLNAALQEHDRPDRRPSRSMDFYG